MKADLIHNLENSGIHFVRVLWCDNANIIRAKAIHLSVLPYYLNHGVGISAAQQAIPVMFDGVVPGTGLGPVGEIRLMPDWSSLQPLPYSPGHARVLGDMILEDNAWPLCPRAFLKREIEDCQSQGFSLRTAFENEFYLLRTNTTHPEPADNTVFASTQSMDRNHLIIEDIICALLQQGIPVELYYPESGPGQQEISFRYSDPLTAADRQIAFRETVHAIACRHGLIASFLPKIFESSAGNGCHLHLSFWEGEKNVTAEGISLSPRARSFVAGILHHLPALMALTTPSTNSYRRIRPHFWSGAFRCWGMDNREAAVRIPSDPAGGGPKQIELKTMDASANPYLALGAVLAAGLDGVRRELELGEAVIIDPGNLSENERKAKGIDALPTNLGMAIEHLEGNEVLRSALGADLARAYLAVRRAEWQALKEMNLEEEVSLLLQRY